MPISSKFKYVTLHLVRNGVRYPQEINPAKIARIGQLFTSSIAQHLRFIMKETKSDILDRVKMRSRPVVHGGKYSESNTMLEAYSEAVRDINMNVSKGFVGARMLDTDVLDKMLPTRDGSRGWWRMHEFGTASLVGASDSHMFVSKEFMKSRKGSRLDEPVGQHDEGIMVHKDSPLLNGVTFQPFKGVKPMRIIRVAKADFEARMLNLKHLIVNDVIRGLS